MSVVSVHIADVGLPKSLGLVRHPRPASSSWTRRRHSRPRAHAVAADGMVTINDATVTTADIVASNGIIHVIDTVILPPAKKM